MKKIGEVIDAIETCYGMYKPGKSCRECPYHTECETHGVPFHTDALNYLKEYREKIDWLEANEKKASELINKYVELIEDYTDNSPLSWEELKWMVGKPIWVESIYSEPVWEIVENVGTAKWVEEEYVETNNSLLRKEDNGKTWRAFRKEK